jgi:hypothetical protein
MTISRDLFSSVISMDSYNRGFTRGIRFRPNESLAPRNEIGGNCDDVVDGALLLVWRDTIGDGAGSANELEEIRDRNLSLAKLLHRGEGLPKACSATNNSTQGGLAA